MLRKHHSWKWRYQKVLTAIKQNVFLYFYDLTFISSEPGIKNIIIRMLRQFHAIYISDGIWRREVGYMHVCRQKTWYIWMKFNFIGTYISNIKLIKYQKEGIYIMYIRYLHTEERQTQHSVYHCTRTWFKFNFIIWARVIKPAAQVLFSFKNNYQYN